MNDKSLLELCLFCSVLGLAILFVGVQLAEAEKVDIGSVDEDYIGRLVAVEGTVYSRYYNGEHLFFTLKDETGKIKVVIFENDIKKMRIEPGEITKDLEIGVEGKVQEY